MASDWVELAVDDVRQNLNSLLEEYDATVEDLAQVVGLPAEEIDNIINGNGSNITLLTFGTLMIAFGKLLKVEDVREHQVQHRGEDDEVPQVRRARRMERPQRPPRENVFTRNHVQRPLDFNEERRIPPLHRPITDTFSRDFADDFRTIVDDFPTPSTMHMGQQPPQRPSKFRNMERAKLVNIIKKNLWDSEIDVRTARFNDLVAFLDEKDRRIKELNSNVPHEHDEFDDDPRVKAFEKEARKAIKENPQLARYINNILSGIGML